MAGPLISEFLRGRTMFNSFTGSGARTRTLGLLATGAVVAGLMAGIPAADAAPSSGKPASAAALSGLGAGRYVVLLREPSASRYNGSKAAYAATKARPGQSFNAQSDAVRK